MKQEAEARALARDEEDDHDNGVFYLIWIEMGMGEGRRARLGNKRRRGL